MKKALKLPNEKLRQDDLDQYEIVDTAPEQGYDAITKLASLICEAPIALVSIIDNDRQWFKSKVGLDAQETPRDISFCGHAIHQDEIFEIKNSLEDSRFCDNPLVTGGPEVIFYAGIPLVSPDGNNLGTLCVIDNKPRELSEKQKQSLRLLSQQVVSLLKLRIANVQLNKQKEILYKQSKLSSLGRMAGGIAHEINTPLAIISLSSSAIVNEVKKTSGSKRIEKACADIDNTVSRISKIIKSLLAISRSKPDEPLQVYSADEVITDAINICTEKLKLASIDLEVVGDTKIKLLCRKEEISQVLINLILNSYDAICGSENRWIKLNINKEGLRVCLSVIDSGPGLDEKYLQHLMEPFYTTKPVGKGTGLGLSISRSILELHEGELKYDENHPNTKFDVYLKAA